MDEKITLTMEDMRRIARYEEDFGKYYESLGEADPDLLGYPYGFRITLENLREALIILIEDEPDPVDVFEKWLAPISYKWEEFGLDKACGWDGENYKFDDNPKNAIFIIQGNANTSAEMRLDALQRIGADLKASMPEVDFSTYVIDVKEDGTNEVEI